MIEDAGDPERMQGLPSRLNDLFQAVHFAIGSLSGASSWEERIEEVLRRLGQAVDASGVYVFEHRQDEEGHCVAALRHEWVAPGISPRKGDPRLANIRVETEGLADCAELLAKAGAQDGKSLVAIPILVGEELWGAVGFDQRGRQREWSPAEVEALQAASVLLGCAIQRERTANAARVNDRDVTQQSCAELELRASEEALRKAHADLERRVQERTADLAEANAKLRKEIAEHRRAEQAVRESERRYRAVVEDQTELICRYLSDGTLTFVNGAYCRHFGKEPDELVGRSFMPLIPEEDRQLVRKGIAALSAENPVQSHEHEVILPDGRIGWQHWTNHAIFDDQGRVTEYQGIGRDITHRKRAEEELREHRDHLEDLVHARTTELTETNRHLQDQIAERKLAEDALRESEQKYRDLAELLPQTVYELDESGMLTFVNRQAFETFGYTRDDFNRGLYALEMLIPEDRDRAGENVNKLLRGEKSSGNEYTALRKDGSTFPIAIFSNRILREGKPVGLRGIIVDLTELRQAEADLRRSEERMRLGLEGSGVCLWDWDVATGRGMSYSRWAEMLGYDPGEIEPGFAAWQEKLHPEDGARVLGALGDHLEGRSPLHENEHRMLAKSGQWKWMLCRGKVIARDADGKPLRAVGMYMDITDLKRAEAALRERENRMRLALAGSNVGLWDWNLATGETTAFRRWAEILGYDPNTIKDGFPTWQQYLHPDDKARVMKALTDHLDGHSSLYEAEHRLRAKSGQWRWMLGRGKVISRDKDGKPLRAVGVYMDIDDRKRAERDLQAARSKLMTAREEERRHFARELHDSVNQRIIALHLRLRGLRQMLRLPQEGALASAIDEFGENILELIEEVRNISHGLYPATLEQMGLDGAMAQLSDDRADQDVPVTVRCDPDIEGVRFRPEVEITIFRIAQEALTNALRHARASNVQITVGRRDDHIVLQVIDNGVGFDPSSVVRGLGLNAMQDRAGAVDGELEISSDPGCTCVEVRIPVEVPTR